MPPFSGSRLNRKLRERNNLLRWAREGRGGMRYCPTEAQEQAVVVEWAKLRGLPLFHIPNGGSRDPREARNLKLQGVRAGVPDLFLPVARKGRHGLFIEMKREKGGTVSKAQREWLELLGREGYAAEVCRGAMEAIRLLKGYLDG